MSDQAALEKEAPLLRLYSNLSEPEKITLRKLNKTHGYEYAQKSKSYICDNIDTPST